MIEKGGTLLNLNDFSFFNPSPDFREMNILRAITENPKISQDRLAKYVGVVPSMINRYISDFEEKGYIKKEGENKRTMRYILLQKGKFRLQFLIISYLREVANLYSQSRETFGKLLDRLLSEGSEKPLLYGAGIIGSIVVDVLRTEGIEPIGFVDDSPAKQDGVFHDLKVYSIDKAKNLNYDAVIIASFKHAQEMVRKAIENGMKNIMIFEISDFGNVSLKKIDIGKNS